MDLTPKGKFPAKAVEWKLAETKGGREQVVVDFKFTDPQLGNILWFGFFTDLTFERTVESLRYMGWTGTDVLELDTPQANLNANEVELVVDHEEYEGKWRAKVKWVNRKGGVDIAAPLAVEKRASFAQRMKASILSMELGKPKGPPTSAKTPPPPAQTGSLDDVPF